MTKLSIISALLLVSSSALAQDGAASNLSAAFFSTAPSLTQVDDADVPHHGQLIRHHGFYAAPMVGVTTLNHELAAVAGMRGAWLANDTVGVGFAFNAMANEVDEKAHFKGRAFGGYGGLLLQYLVAADQVVHGSFDTTIGGGFICQQTGNVEQRDDCVGHGFFALEPMANMEINVFSAMRISLGAGYRLAIAGNDSPLKSMEIGGFVSKAALQFGKF
jgi:hypothetical protein